MLRKLRDEEPARPSSKVRTGRENSNAVAAGSVFSANLELTNHAPSFVKSRSQARSQTVRFLIAKPSPDEFVEAGLVVAGSEKNSDPLTDAPENRTRIRSAASESRPLQVAIGAPD